MENQNLLAGKRVTLRPATLAERPLIYQWAACSDSTAAMIGPPTFPDNPIPTWEEFCADHKDHFFDGSAPELGRCYLILVNDEPLGQVYYNDIDVYDGKRRTELDIWMRSEADCGKGYGSDALLTLCDYLAAHWAVTEFLLQPSARNPRAIRAYEKIGFRRLDLPLEEAARIWKSNDYFDSVYLFKILSPAT